MAVLVRKLGSEKVKNFMKDFDLIVRVQNTTTFNQHLAAVCKVKPITCPDKGSLKVDASPPACTSYECVCFETNSVRQRDPLAAMTFSDYSSPPPWRPLEVKLK